MIPVSIPNLTGNEKKYLNECIDTTFVSSYGESVNRFEEMVGKATRSTYVVATNSGTTGLHVALITLGVGQGDLVVIPTFSFIASANAIRHCGADPWLMGINEDNWCLDPAKVQAELESKCEKTSAGLIHKDSGRRVAAIMPVYTLGNIPDMDKFRRIADEYRIPLIADAGCAIGSTYKGRPLGGLADLSIFSFNGNKTITCGAGGAIIGNSRELLGRVRHLSTSARLWPDYDFDEVGFDYRMTNIQAAVGCAQMERLDEFVETKRRIRKYYSDALDALKDKGISFYPCTEGSSCWLSGIVLPEGSKHSDVKELCVKMKEKGVEVKPFWKPVHLQKPYIASLVSDVNVSENLWQRLVNLPCSTGISDEELEMVAGAVLSAI